MRFLHTDRGTAIYRCQYCGMTIKHVFEPRRTVPCPVGCDNKKFRREFVVVTEYGVSDDI
jgi:hypothetical protein